MDGTYGTSDCRKKVQVFIDMTPLCLVINNVSEEIATVAVAAVSA
jgi:hypothetical protein